MQKTVCLYFDITDIVEYAMSHLQVSGIQRAALKIIESLIQRQRGIKAFGLVKHPVKGTFCVADLSFMLGPFNLSDFASRFELPLGKDRWLHRKLRKYKRHSFKRHVANCKLTAKYLFSYKLRREISVLCNSQRPSCLTNEALAPESIIVTLGAGWGTDYTAVDKLAQRYQCKVVSFVHDIFPLTKPQITAFIKKNKKDEFQKWFQHITTRSSLIICNSYYTRSQIEAHNENYNGSVSVIKFPHEFGMLFSESGIIRQSVLAASEQKYVLCVGTIESRKNVYELLTTWKDLQLHKPGEFPSLVLAGRKGWAVDDVYQFLENTSYLNGKVEIVDSPNDAELEYLYRNCQFSVFPSLLEGWGLPIGESLWFHKPVLCANSASMPEVGGEFATYFDHAEPGSLLKALVNMIDHPPTLPNDIRAHLTTWEQTACSVWSEISQKLEIVRVS